MAENSELLYFYSISSDRERYDFYVSSNIISNKKRKNNHNILEEMTLNRKELLEKCCKLIKYDLNTMYPMMKTCSMIVSDNYRKKYLVTYIADAHNKSVFIVGLSNIVGSKSKVSIKTEFV